MDPTRISANRGIDLPPLQPIKEENKIPSEIDSRASKIGSEVLTNFSLKSPPLQAKKGLAPTFSAPANNHQANSSVRNHHPDKVSDGQVDHEKLKSLNEQLMNLLDLREAVKQRISDQGFKISVVDEKGAYSLVDPIIAHHFSKKELSSLLIRLNPSEKTDYYDGGVAAVPPDHAMAKSDSVIIDGKRCKIEVVTGGELDAFIGLLDQYAKLNTQIEEVSKQIQLETAKASTASEKVLDSRPSQATLLPANSPPVRKIKMDNGSISLMASHILKASLEHIYREERKEEERSQEKDLEVRDTQARIIRQGIEKAAIQKDGIVYSENTPLNRD